MSTYLIYKNQFNEVKTYDAVILSVNKAHTWVEDMSNGSFKTFITENILGEFESYVEAKNFAKTAQEQFVIIPKNKTGKKHVNREGKTEICFTGFKAQIKKEMISRAENDGFFIRKSVVATLDILVCGDNAGPTKMKKAHEQNVALVFGHDGFVNFLETGEVSE